MFSMIALAPASTPLSDRAGASGGTAPRPRRRHWSIFTLHVDGTRVPQRFTVKIGLKEMGVAPAGVVKQFHRAPSPADRHRHGAARSADPLRLQSYSFGRWTDRVVLTLPQGTHTLQLLLGDHQHVPHQPPVMSKKITIYVR